MEKKTGFRNPASVMAVLLMAAGAGGALFYAMQPSAKPPLRPGKVKGSGRHSAAVPRSAGQGQAGSSRTGTGAGELDREKVQDRTGLVTQEWLPATRWRAKQSRITVAEEAAKRPELSSSTSFRKIVPHAQAVPPIPLRLEGETWPVFLAMPDSLEGPGGDQEAEGDPVSPGQGPPLENEDRSEVEATALTEAEKLFREALAAAPDQNPASQDYADWWSAARQRAENHLRLVLGWDRFNTLRPGQLSGKTSRIVEGFREDPKER